MRRAALLALALLACAPSAKEVKDAREAAYDTESARVWKTIVDEVRAVYPNVKLEDSRAMRLETDWHLIEKDIYEKEFSRENNARGAEASGLAGKWFRMLVTVSSASPWKITVTGEAAMYRRELVMLQPYRRGADDEPHWVQGRIDRMYVTLHEKLKAYSAR